MNEKDLQRMLNICALNEIQRLQEEEELEEERRKEELQKETEDQAQNQSTAAHPPVHPSSFGPQKIETDSNDFLFQLGCAAVTGIASKIFKRK